MALRPRLAGGVLAVVLAAGNSGAFARPVWAQQLAQVTPNAITGQLDENSPTLEGRYVTLHTYEGTAGETVTFELASPDFDALIFLLGPDEELIGHDNNSGDGTNARLTIELPSTGTYQIAVVSVSSGETGTYILSWRTTTAADMALHRADQLTQQVIELYRAGRYSDAIPLAEEALAIRQGQLGQDHPDVATSLNNLAGLYQAQGRYGEAEPLYQRAMAILQGQLGEDHPNVATNLNNLAALYQAQGRYGEAEPLYQQSLTIRQELLGEGHPDVAASLNNLAKLYSDQGRYGEAEPLYQQALAIFQARRGERHPDVASSLNNLAALYRAQGRYGEAEPLYQQALAIWQELLGEDHPDVATSLNNLALLYLDQGRHGEAEPLLQQALAIRQELLGERHPDVASSLNNLAGLYQVQGRYKEAEPLFQQALAIRQTELGERHPSVALNLNNLALLYLDQGRYGEAEPLLQQALAIRQELLGEEHPDVATSLNNLARLYSEQGRYREAKPLYQQALSILQELLGERHPDVATSLNNLAAMYRAQRRYGEAEPLYQQALAIRQEELGERHPDVANSLNNLAGLYEAQGRYGEAEPLYQQALAIRQTELGERHPDVAASLNNLAALYEAQGRYGEAKPFFQQSLAIWQEVLGERHPNIATSLINLAGLSQAQGNPPQAIAYLQHGLAIEEEHLDANFATLAEAQRQDYAAQITGTTNQAISLNLNQASDSAEASQLALTTLLRRKGRLLDAATSSLQALRQNLTPNDQAILDELIATRTQLATLLFNPPAELSAEAYQAEITRLEARENDLSSTLTRRSAAFRAESQPVTLAAVQAQLPQDAVLVEFTRYRPVNATDPANRFGTPRYAAYLLFPNGTIEAIDLGEAAAIDDAVATFGTLLQNPSADLRATVVPQYRPEAVEDITGTLKALILDPIAPYLQDRQHLLISPDSQLNRLPFEALLTDSGQYLVEQYQISYLNSGRDLLKFDVLEPSTAPAVIIANPDYDSAAPFDSAPFDSAPFDSAQGAGGSSGITDSPGESLAGPSGRDQGVLASSDVTKPGRSLSSATNRRSGDLSQLQVGPLPGTAAEAEALRSLLPNAAILTEAAATENAIKQVQAPRILHVATHGFFLPDVARPEADGPLGSPSRPMTENPLLRSGLTLAGFNARSSGDDDGVFTALEASNLNLFGTQLVVLSACDTGLGEVASGEGVYGLRRAFAIAGAESQLLSLWKVSDDGTQSLMSRYYEQLMAGMGRSEALRAVQLAMIAEGGEYSHPYYWSAFILAGDWKAL